MSDYTKTVTKLRDVYRAYVVTGNEKAGQFLADAAAAIEALQAQLPKRGEWIEVDGLYKCSVCGELECCRGKYCPDCGAKMEVQE